MKPSLKPGLILRERYLILEIIETEENYRVYVSKDQQSNNENCILREFIASDENEAVRVHKELESIIQQIKALKHPHIEKIEDFWLQGEVLYLVQSYFEGETNQARLSKGYLLTEDEVIELLKQILPVLSYLHSQSIVHGDISPSHLLRNSDETLILTHFGILREIASQMGIETSDAKLLDKVKGLSRFPYGSGQDLSALAVTVLMLLTGKEPQDLFNDQSQTWDWENYKLLSDRLTDVLNQMLPTNQTVSLTSADEIIALLEPSKTSPTVSTVPLSSPFTSHTEQVNPETNSESSQTNSPGFRVVLIVASIMVVFTGIATFAINQFRNSENVVVDFPSPSPSLDAQTPNQFEFTPPTPSSQKNGSSTNATISGIPGTKNVRSGAGTVYGVIGELTTGTRVQIISSSYDSGGYLWYQIYHPSSGLRGWVAEQLITRD
ncbi:hypothetical protein PCC7424_5597 (plasmid) [Gloeothece citriformis PCC 7424]|uniref:Serine/threonine protein kinase n=1 Tax=Gloeothece citriformis (strain PCC 7424) TaxID=65393 RepID=B7KMY7_GLOC7|nr:protein kinase [Gloeothece citriformis]ACK74159.1 hypothetical protein PCC7424_5597 [Gloeothece citriformis PCC 7424]